MQVIGLTGGVGCGKSTIVRLMKEHFSCLALETDEIAREQMKPGAAAYTKVVEEFGEEILAEEGSAFENRKQGLAEIDRAKLAELVFARPERLKKLNALTHPLVTEEVLRAVAEERKNPQHDIVLIETALLIEGGYDSFCDQVWYVFATEAERRRRLRESRGYSEEKITDLFCRQKTEAEFRKVADAVIPNGDHQTEAELLEYLKGILKESSNSIQFIGNSQK